MHNPLFDQEFLQELDAYPHKETHVQIIALDYNDLPIEKIEGVITGGSMNVDGASAVRRTCQLTIVAPIGTAITEMAWAFKRKFKVNIGVANFINPKYEDIIWFPQGVFIITGFSKSETTSALNITISGQDKMCRLNGTVSGSLPVEVDFAHYDEPDENGKLITHDELIYNIIRMAVREYGQEPEHNIIINDLDIEGLELWNYRGNIPFYIYYEPNSERALGMTFDTNNSIAILSKQSDSPDWFYTKLSELEQYYTLNALDIKVNDNATLVKYCQSGVGPLDANVIKIDKGMTAGYHQTPLIYAGDLIAKAGTPVTTAVLDKIKNMLGEYEYFYNIDGRFVFQKKKTYINELFSPIHGDIVEPMMTVTPYAYYFNDKSMLTNISYSPNVQDIKNDFILWGKKDGGAPIHARFAIQKKPFYYQTYRDEKTESGGVIYRTEGNAEEENIVDWREIIYQMARDYNLYNQREDYYHQIDNNNILIEKTGEEEVSTHLYVDGKTGYEQYYTDLYSFWRYLYDLHPTRDENSYYPYQDYYPADSAIKPGWNKMIHTAPEQLIFWFDFLDVGDAPLAAYSVDAIGDRIKVENVQDNSTIYVAKTPEILFTFGNEKLNDQQATSGYSIANISEDKRELFNVASKQIALISKANELIYKHVCCAENITLTTIPIFHLEPNSRIYVEDIGDLIITKINYNLSYNATMNLTCTKVVQSIY